MARSALCPYYDNPDTPFQYHPTMQVDEHIPAEKVLKFNVKQGWKPLVDFLGIPSDVVQEGQAFPHVNDSKAMKTAGKVLDIIAMSGPILALLLLWLASRVVAKVLGLVMPPRSSSAKAKKL